MINDVRGGSVASRAAEPFAAGQTSDNRTRIVYAAVTAMLVWTNVSVLADSLASVWRQFLLFFLFGNLLLLLGCAC